MNYLKVSLQTNRKKEISTKIEVIRISKIKAVQLKKWGNELQATGSVQHQPFSRLCLFSHTNTNWDPKSFWTCLWICVYHRAVENHAPQLFLQELKTYQSISLNLSNRESNLQKELHRASRICGIMWEGFVFLKSLAYQKGGESIDKKRIYLATLPKELRAIKESREMILSRKEHTKELSNTKWTDLKTNTQCTHNVGV